MGLDITICVNNMDEVYSGDFFNSQPGYYKHRLSRTFCDFMCRRNIINGEPELDQIGRITAVDISPIYALETDGGDSEEELVFFLETVDSEEERQMVSEHAKKNKQKLKGNIDIVLLTVNSLIDKLSAIDNLPGLLNDHGHDTLDYKHYFTDFNIDKGEGYIDNNFGQDLRNFKRFLEFAKSKGTTTVYFNYG